MQLIMLSFYPLYLNITPLPHKFLVKEYTDGAIYSITKCKLLHAPNPVTADWSLSGKPNTIKGTVSSFVASLGLMGSLPMFTCAKPSDGLLTT